MEGGAGRFGGLGRVLGLAGWFESEMGELLARPFLWLVDVVEIENGAFAGGVVDDFELLGDP